MRRSNCYQRARGEESSNGCHPDFQQTVGQFEWWELRPETLGCQPSLLVDGYHLQPRQLELNKPNETSFHSRDERDWDAAGQLFLLPSPTEMARRRASWGCVRECGSVDDLWLKGDAGAERTWDWSWNGGRAGTDVECCS